MSAVVAEAGKGRGAQSQDFELNIASIIDCFTVLITFMLASAAFISLGILDAGVSAAASAPKDTAPPPINIVLELSKSQKITVKVTGKANHTIPIEAKSGAWDFDTLTQNLATLKAKWPMVTAVTLSAEEMVEYKDVVKTMEVTRKTLPVVLLGGF